jgi:hypothetical protein
MWAGPSWAQASQRPARQQRGKGRCAEEVDGPACWKEESLHPCAALKECRCCPPCDGHDHDHDHDPQRCHEGDLDHDLGHDLCHGLCPPCLSWACRRRRRGSQSPHRRSVMWDPCCAPNGLETTLTIHGTRDTPLLTARELISVILAMASRHFLEAMRNLLHPLGLLSRGGAKHTERPHGCTDTKLHARGLSRHFDAVLRM